MKKFLFVLLIFSSMVFGFTQCESKPKDAEVVILSVNDMHASIDMFPQFAAMVDSLRNIYPDMLLFSAGDNRTGNPINDQYDPTNYPMTALMNQVKFDLSALGNHEFDGNIDALQKNIEQSTFPYICANVLIPDSVSLNVKPYVIFEKQGFKIAVLGLIQTDASGLPSAHPKNLEKLGFVPAMDVMPQYQNLKEQSDVMILLSHCGFEYDARIAQAYPDINLIIGGHSHTLVEEPRAINGVLIEQSGSHLKYATLTKIKFVEGKVESIKAEVLNVKKFKGTDETVKSMLKDFNDVDLFNEVLAQASSRFSNKAEIGCMMTDAIREMTEADFAFQNTGGVRVPFLNQGPITIKDIYTIDPFNNDIVVFKMTGSQVKEFIMKSYLDNGGHPSHVSGMQYEVLTDGRTPKTVNIKMDRRKFDDKATYRVAMNSYMASTIVFESIDQGVSQFRTSEEMMIDFLRKQKTVDYKGAKRV